jgi:hypothetical protein
MTGSSTQGSKAVWSGALPTWSPSTKGDKA